MELVEREQFLQTLQAKAQSIADGEGQCVFIGGEAGIGKTTLVKTFCKKLNASFRIYQGTCDALFTPRPLAPLYDVLWQVGANAYKSSVDAEERTILFANFLTELKNIAFPVVIVFEDIHWADEATLDFIKFFARRVTQVHCLFLLTYRDNEIHARHPLRSVLGQLPSDSFARMQLPPLSRQAVEKMADQKGFNGDDVYSISGGNPFYVTEILASYSQGIPENIRDAVLSVFNSQDELTRQLWELLSVVPSGIGVSFLEKKESGFTTAIERGLESSILVFSGTKLFFKHELYRRTIETSLSPLKRVALNKTILALLREHFEKKGEIEKIVHHAKNANEYDLVVQYAPLAAKQAINVSAHIEAARLYLTAIEYYQENDKDLLLKFYEAYAYECYLTNQIQEAIIYTSKAMQLWKEKNNVEKTGNSLRFLSRLWWYAGNRKNAESFGVQAIETLQHEPSSTAKAMAFSNMSQLKMLGYEVEDCVYWGEKAIAIAHELNDEETLSHALNNVGSAQMKDEQTNAIATTQLQQSLAIALKNGYPEHAARAYTNISSIAFDTKNYAVALEAFNEGIHYCEEKDLDSWNFYMQSWKARLKLDTCEWEEAFAIANNLMKIETQPNIVKISCLLVMATIKIRKGEKDVTPILQEAMSKALEAMEIQRIVPVLAVALEYEWITSEKIATEESIEYVRKSFKESSHFYLYSEMAFWLSKTQRPPLQSANKVYAGYDVSTPQKILEAAGLWKEKKCLYNQALVLFEGNENQKKQAVAIVQELGATATYEKLKQEMRNAGIKSIPRGARKTTLANVAQLTDREVDVLKLLQQNLQNKEIAGRLFISAKTVDHHISSILFKLDVNSRTKAVDEAKRLSII